MAEAFVLLCSPEFHQQVLTVMSVPVSSFNALEPSFPSRPAGSVPLVLRMPAKIAMAVAIGTALGLGATAWLLDRRIDIAAAHVGPWAAWPKAGTPDMDPYARAIYAQTGQIALVSAEGLLLEADTDESGTPLTGRCSYTIAGGLMAARFWTLSVATSAGTPIDNPASRSVFTSSDVLRRSDGTFSIEASSSARPGNWLPLSAEDRLTLALRLYDSPLGNTLAQLDRTALPSIRKVACQ